MFQILSYLPYYFPGYKYQWHGPEISLATGVRCYRTENHSHSKGAIWRAGMSCGWLEGWRRALGIFPEIHLKTSQRREMGGTGRFEYVKSILVCFVKKFNTAVTCPLSNPLLDIFPFSTRDEGRSCWCLESLNRKEPLSSILELYKSPLLLHLPLKTQEDLSFSLF